MRHRRAQQAVAALAAAVARHRPQVDRPVVVAVKLVQAAAAARALARSENNGEELEQRVQDKIREGQSNASRLREEHHQSMEAKQQAMDAELAATRDESRRAADAQIAAVRDQAAAAVESAATVARTQRPQLQTHIETEIVRRVFGAWQIFRSAPRHARAVSRTIESRRRLQVLARTFLAWQRSHAKAKAEQALQATKSAAAMEAEQQQQAREQSQAAVSRGRS